MIDPNKLMRSVFLALALLFATPLAGAALPLLGAAQAQAAGIARISVSGNHAVDAETIESIILVKVGQPATANAISQSIDALYKTGLFSSVSVTQSGSTLFVRVSENPIIASVLFKGNQRFSDAELLTMVQASSRAAYSPDRVQGDVAAIKQAYLAAGYTGATVNAQTQTVDGGRKLVTFDINEGARSGITAINFTGNSAFGAGTLKGVIRTKETGFLSWLLHDDSYTPEQLEIDKQLIRQYYANHGYPDVQVTSAVAEFNTAKNGYYITFTIVEGQRYEFGPSAIETSIPNLNTNSLQNTVVASTGNAYSQAQLQKTAADMAFQATQEGYPFADVRPRVDRDDANHRLNITYLVDNGPRVYVERINITGNVKTRDFVIRRELDFNEGDPFNQEIWSIATRRRSCRSASSRASTSRPSRAVRPTRWSLTSTWSSSRPATMASRPAIRRPTVSWVKCRSPSATSLGVASTSGPPLAPRRSARPSTSRSPSPISWASRCRRASTCRPHHRPDRDQLLWPAVHQGRQAGTITDAISANAFLGYEQDSYSTGYNFSTDPTFTPPYGAQSVQSQLVANGTVRNKAFIGYNLNYVTIDDQKHPTTGMYAVLSQQYAGWDANVLKTELKARYFVPVSDTGMVASIRGQAGIVNSLGGNGVNALDDLQEGSTLVRGFEYGGYGPRLKPQGTVCNTDPSAPGPGCTDLSSHGGEYVGETGYAGLSAELQFPIPMLPESYGLDGAIWADSAYISGTPNIGTLGGTLDPASTDNPVQASNT